MSWKTLEVEHNNVCFLMASAKRDAVEQKMLAWAAALGKDCDAIAAMREHAGGFGIAAESALSQALKKPDAEKALRQSIERHLQPVPTQSHGRSFGR